MWKRRLAPAGVKKADAGILVSHIGGGFDRPPIRLELKRHLLPAKLDQIMKRPHEAWLTGFDDSCRLWTLPAEGY
jgi:hypothetical protein